MKTFKDLKFTQHKTWTDGTIAQLFFDNGYGVSVITGQYAYNNKDTYEVAILKGTADNWTFVKDLDKADIIKGWQTKREITKLMKLIQAIPRGINLSKSEHLINIS